MKLSQNEKALVNESLGRVEATFNSLLYISGDENIDKNKIIEALSMSIIDLELTHQSLIRVLNKVRAGR